MTKVDDSREHSSKTKVEAFWEIAIIMDANMYVVRLVGTRRTYGFA
jgi:hypothetical protein